MRHIEIFLRDGIPPVVHEVKTDGLALKVHTGLIGHPALQLLAGQVVTLAVLDEHSAGLNKAEGHVGIHAFLPERLDPVSYTHLVAFVIQMEGITEVRPNVSTQPEFGTALAEAKAAGVRVLFLLCRVGRDSLEIVEQREG